MYLFECYLLSIISEKLFFFTKSKVTWSLRAPFIIVPIILLLAAISQTVTITVIVCLGMGALYINSRPRSKNRSQFFFSWTVSSGLNMFLVFQFEVMEYLEITHFEYILFIILVICTCYFFYLMKSTADLELANGSAKGEEYSPVLTSDYYYCKICEIAVNEGYFHSIWWDCCVLKQNYGYFLSGHVFGLATLLYGSNLALTTVCLPYIGNGLIEMPDDCSELYDNYILAVTFVTVVYSLGYALVICLVFLHQLMISIPKYGASQWKKMSHVLNV